MVYLLRRFQKIINKHGGFQKKGLTNRATMQMIFVTNVGSLVVLWDAAKTRSRKLRTSNIIEWTRS